MAEEKVSDADELQSKIFEVMSKHPKGVSSEIILGAIPTMTAPQLVQCLNKLIAQHKIQILKKKESSQLVYKLKDAPTQKYQGTDIQEKIVFEAIERAGNNGIASKDLKAQTQLVLTLINKILKSLEGKKMIKSVTSSSRKKLFMLYDLEPSPTVTGGPFYTGEEYESEFVDTITSHCYKYLVQAKAVAEKEHFDPMSQKNASCKSAIEICDYINGTKISNVKLSLQDIEEILSSLVYDDKIEKFSSRSSTSETLYRCSNPLIVSSSLMMVPCGVCRVYMDCHINGEVSPATCVYMKEWLDF